MGFESIQSAVNADIIETFKLEVIAVYNSVTDVDGVFTNDYADASEGAVLFESRGPSFVCQSADVPAIARGDTFVINEVVYSVTGIEPDGTGLLLLKLRSG